MNMRPTWIVTFLSLGLGCQSTPGAEPHDMSAAGHAAAASGHEAEAARHASLYAADAGAVRERCPGGANLASTSLCWTSVANPTEDHLREAERHRRMAADHRAASQALRDAEASACVGISDADRDMSPFEHRDDIASVTPLIERVASARQVLSRTAGVVVTFRAVPGLTAEWLQRVVNCHLARNAALGHQVPEMPDCPLVPNGVSATVTSTGDGFAVAIRAEEEGALEEVQRRARALATPR